MGSSSARGMAAVVALAGMLGAGCMRMMTRGEEQLMKPEVLDFAAKDLGSDKRYLSAERIDNPFFRSWKLWRVSTEAIPPQTLFVATNGQELRKMVL